eukprot:TRINITY_DN4926_c0_g1_i5.p2 TRINITY_DN4926_c0_g1~~TRINITY_DN4926_c0_g1_i5.p2  ORF type:complete len:131 (-),score=20.40 TRINITY_DN4926_c0_g1_i5:60-452(-)
MKFNTLAAADGGFDFSYVPNVIWLMIITMTTVGFGDGFPQTHMGRVIGVFGCIIGMALVSLLVVSLTQSSEFTAAEEKAFNLLKILNSNEAAGSSASNVVRTLLKLHHLNVTNSGFAQRFILVVLSLIHI